MRTTRPERVASIIRQEVARTLLYESKDPGLQGIVITGARVSKDLRVAWISYQVHDGSERGKEVARLCLEHARGFLRERLKVRVAMRTLPELRFEIDDRVTSVERIDEILRSVDRGPVAGEPEKGD